LAGHPGGHVGGHPGGHPGGTHPQDGPAGGTGGGAGGSPAHRKLHLLAWETTRACPFACPHCRASAVAQRESGELSTAEGIKLLTEAARVGPGIVIMSGGEPLLRTDLEELVQAGTKLGQTVVVAGNDGALFTTERIRSLQEAGVKRFSFSLHASQDERQDAFLGRPGAFAETREAFKRLLAAGMSFQINTTVLPSNHRDLPVMLEAVKAMGAAAWHLFFVVNTGRAAETRPSDTLDDEANERVLEWVADVYGQPGVPPMKVTCAPHHSRIFIQKGKKLPSHGRSCMAGDGFAFVSSFGEVKPCGYFDLVAGSVRERPFDEIYLHSELFRTLRDLERLEGTCGACEYRKVCGGCRARAFAGSGNFMGSDPSCRHRPVSHARSGLGPQS